MPESSSPTHPAFPAPEEERVTPAAADGRLHEEQALAPADVVEAGERPEPSAPPTRDRPRGLTRLLRLGLLLAGAGLAMLAASLALIDVGISLATRGAIAVSMDEVEPAPVALLLGTSRTHRGKPNRFYQARIEAAAALFHQGRVRGILVSGDNATRYYNEPIAMQKDLMALGVPAEYITPDYAGFRTLDSMVRAKEVFGLDKLLVVSQGFHAARAIFLARHFGIDARGFAAPDPPHSGFLKVRAREVLARAAAVLDIVTGQGPRYLGKPETVRLREETPAIQG